MTYSLDFRKKVLAIREREGLAIDTVAKRFGVGKASVMRWIKTLEPKKNRQKSPLNIHDAWLKTDIERYPDSYQYERAQRLGVSRSGIGWALKRLRVSYKKNARTSKGQ